jgi:hypothetical protein
VRPIAEFLEWPLHDAILHSIRFDWEARRCVIVLDAVLAQEQEAKRCQVEFERVTNLNVPCKAPWASSVHINGQSIAGREFVIEMQSGDEIHVEADSASLVQR